MKIHTYNLFLESYNSEENNSEEIENLKSKFQIGDIIRSSSFNNEDVVIIKIDWNEPGKITVKFLSNGKKDYSGWRMLLCCEKIGHINIEDINDIVKNNIKNFLEEIKKRGGPQLEDYIICEFPVVIAKGSYSGIINIDYNFFKLYIGKIKNIFNTPEDSVKVDAYPYVVKYNTSEMTEEQRAIFYNNARYTDKNSWVVKKKEIIYWSKNKKDLEPFIAATKYNL